MSKKSTYSNYDIDQLKKQLKEMHNIFFLEILEDSKYDNFLCRESFEKHKHRIWRSAGNMRKIEEFMDSMKDDNE